LYPFLSEITEHAQHLSLSLFLASYSAVPLLPEFSKHYLKVFHPEVSSLVQKILERFCHFLLLSLELFQLENNLLLSFFLGGKN
jgi:hypothetical protein